MLLNNTVSSYSHDEASQLGSKDYRVEIWHEHNLFWDVTGWTYGFTLHSASKTTNSVHVSVHLYFLAHHSGAYSLSKTGRDFLLPLWFHWKMCRKVRGFGTGERQRRSVNNKCSHRVIRPPTHKQRCSENAFMTRSLRPHSEVVWATCDHSLSPL